ncbi:MAG: hypothetical protein EXR69_00080 [Myxococcales bacterium]|nr:hypothetical protein [Myxococcales bacterium]
MSPFGLVGVSVGVVGALVPGTAVGIWLGRSGREAWAPAVCLLAAEVLATRWLGEPVYGLSAYVLCVGRAAGRIDPRLRALGARLGLHRFGDVEFPLVAPGVFAAASLAFAVQMGARLPVGPGAAIALVFALAALAIDLQHRSALVEGGALRGSVGPVLLPQLSVAEHLVAASAAVPAELASVLQRRPRHLTVEQRERLERCLTTSPL